MLENVVVSNKKISSIQIGEKNFSLITNYLERVLESKLHALFRRIKSVPGKSWKERVRATANIHFSPDRDTSLFESKQILRTFRKHLDAIDPPSKLTIVPFSLRVSFQLMRTSHENPIHENPLLDI